MKQALLYVWQLPQNLLGLAVYITEWSSPITEDMVLKYFQKPNSNKMVKNQYNLYKNKQNYIDRLNQLTPMEIITPIGAAGLTGYGLNEKE